MSFKGHFKAFGKSFVDFDIVPVSVRQLRKSRRGEAFWSIVNFMSLVGTMALTPKIGLWWAVPLSFLLISSSIRHAMRAISAHKQIPIQTVREVMGA